jgi:hypothetical protein
MLPSIARTPNSGYSPSRNMPASRLTKPANYSANSRVRNCAIGRAPFRFSCEPAHWEGSGEGADTRG